MAHTTNMKLRNATIPRKRSRAKRLPAEAREARLRERMVEALTWLDQHAPGRAHNSLTEGLRETHSQAA
jgi:hypothetical protein